MNQSNAIVPGSLAAISERNGASLAETFMSADAIILVDVSGSMGANDAPGGRQRYQMACDELAKVQADLPGKVAVVSFSSSSQFVPGGVPVFLSGGTNLADALRFVQPADGTVEFIVISDGQPDNEAEALRIAGQFQSDISVVFCGPEDDKYGRDFLRQLAAASGGAYVESLKTAGLGKNIGLLLAAG